MPFQIIRNDITKVNTDAIVNTANPKPVIGGGTDSAIYVAAGEDRLLAERKKIGDIPRGKAVITPGFDLEAKYIIHTVGPAWQGGNQGEFDILRDCYRNSLELAKQNKCKSIAFPLIATGVYGFPKDKALQIATSTIQEFLFENDMLILLVVFDRKAFELSGKVYSDIRSYVDENYVDTSHEREYSRRNRDARIREELERERLQHSLAGHAFSTENEPLDLPDRENGTVYGDLVSDASEKSLNELVGNPADNFRDRLFELIDKSGMDDPTVYKDACISKKVFSDIKNRPDYKPSKKTALSFAIALKLTLEETQDLLARAGLTLSPSSRFDLVMAYCISHGIHDFVTINNALFDNDQECIGALE